MLDSDNNSSDNLIKGLALNLIPELNNLANNIMSPIQKMPMLERKQSHVVGIPRDQKLILKMLLRPQAFGTGLFDYSCNGANWFVSDEVMGR